MTKTELINAISDKTNYTEASVKEILNAFIEVVMEQVSKNDDVILIGFGRFSKHRRAARHIWGFNGKVHKMEATTIPYFKAGSEFKKRVRRKK